MINVYHLSNATPVALFGMFAIWAAASKRHWFVRTSVVAAAILVVLFIPAFEVVILLSVQCVLVAIGMAIWSVAPAPPCRARSSMDVVAPATASRMQLSMQTMLLAVVIVAVVTAVVSRAPRLKPEQWYDLVLDGFMSATICLTCVWIVYGRPRWGLRLAAAPLLPFVLASVYHLLHWIGNLVNHWFRVSQPPFSQYLQTAFRDWGGLRFWITTTVLGMVVLCVWLFLVRRAKWFDPFDETTATQPPPHESRRQVTVARIGALALFGMASIFPLILFYELVTPRPIPHIQLPNPNGFDDFLAAGKMIGPNAAVTLGNWSQLTTPELDAELEKHRDAFARMHEGLKKPSWHPYVFKPWPQDDYLALTYLLNALRGQAAFYRQTNQPELELENMLDLLRLSHKITRGMSADEDFQFEWDAHVNIWKMCAQLSATRCVELAKDLSSLDLDREPWSVREERQRIIDANHGWKRHLQTILLRWYGNDQFDYKHMQYLNRVAELRMLILKLAIRAYQLENNRLPAHLSELVPTYLPAIPDDPFGDGSIKYLVTGESYRLYCMGPDGDDDGGVPSSTGSNEEGDLTDASLFPPPIGSPQAKLPWVSPP